MNVSLRFPCPARPSMTVMATNAPDSGKSTELYEAFVSSVPEVLREVRRGGAKDLCITGDLNVELGMFGRGSGSTKTL